MTAKAEPPFSAKGRLTRLEKALIGAVEAGETFRPSAEDLESGEAIRGGLIRAMLLGTPLRHHPARGLVASGRPVRLTPHGVRIVPDAKAAADPRPPLLRIAGRLDARGLAAPGGGFLPPLELSYCAFAEPIELAGALLHSLTLTGCRFARLDAEGARFNGGVAVSGCGPRSEPVDPQERRFAGRLFAACRYGRFGYFVRAAPRGPPAETGCACALCTNPGGRDGGEQCNLCCVLDFYAAQVAGTLRITRSYLRAPGIIRRNYVTPVPRDKLALDLSRVQVRDSVAILRSTLIGRASFVGGEIGDDVWVLGSKLFAAAERPTVDFQLAKVGGILAFVADRATTEEKEGGIRALPVAVVGQVSAIGLEAGEVWIGEGFFYGQDRRRRGSYPTINFAKSNIRRTLKIGAYHEYHVLDPDRPTATAHVHGEICLLATNIDKNLEIHGVDCDGVADAMELSNPFFNDFGVRIQPAYLKLGAHGLKVDRRAYISHGNFRDIDAAKGEAAIAADIASGLCPEERVPAAIDLWKSTIGTGFRMGENSQCAGPIRLNSCVIGREVIIGCRTISEGPPGCATGRPGAIPLLLDIGESTIRGHLRIGRHEPRLKPRAPGATGPPEKEAEAITIHGGVSLRSAAVQGSVLLGHVTFDLARYRWDPAVPGETAKAPVEDERLALDLRDCACGSDLEVHALRWKLPDLEEAEKARLAKCPSGWAALWPPSHKWRFFPIGESHLAEIDLRGLRCGMLIDGFGAHWGLIYRMRIRLAGMKIGEVEPSCHQTLHRPVGPAARLRWLASQNSYQEICAEAETPPEPEEAAIRPPAERPPALSKAWSHLWQRHYCSRDEDFVPQAYNVFSSAYRRSGEDDTAEEILVEKKNIQNALRFRRLRDQWMEHVWPRFLAVFVSGRAQPAAAGIGTGGEARPKYQWPKWWETLVVVALAAWILTLASRFVASDGPGPGWAALVIGGMVLVILAWPLLVALFQLTFRIGFRYGLSPDSALAVFSVCIVVGWLGVHVARNGSLEAVRQWPTEASADALPANVALVLDVEYEPADDRRPDPKAGDAPETPMRTLGHAIRARPSPCNVNVNSLLYAVDIFIPLIDLDQERRCGIRDAAPNGHDPYAKWRFFKALYELLGWIITSLVILTFTGVLRRDLEH